MNEASINLMQETLTFWDNLSGAEKKLLIDNTFETNYKQGENIHSASNDCVGVLIIKSGELRTYLLSEVGKEVTLFRRNPGDVCVLAASCMFKNITFDVHIDAETDCEMLLINSSAFSQLQTQNIYAENFSLKIAANGFSDVMWAMEQILFMSFDQRLAVFLFDELAKSNSDDIKLTHEQIAKYIGSAREVVSRMLKYFENEGLVKLHRGGVQIIDRQKLKKLVQ